MCPVFRAQNRSTGQLVAIKILPPGLAKNPILFRRFKQEFHAAFALPHPNIVRALDFSEEGSTPFLVMEYIEGMSLGEKVAREGRMPEADAIRLILQVCRGLQYAHDRGVIHRDVKPDNILVTPAGEAKLTDLGLVKEMLSDHNLTRTGGGLGTPHYMAPEQFHNAKNADARCDVYGLGSTLYTMVTGELPFGNLGPMQVCQKKIQGELPSAQARVPGLSKRIDRTIRWAMAANRDKRLASCLEFEQELTDTRPTSFSDPHNDYEESETEELSSSGSRPAGVERLTWVILSMVALGAMIAGFFLFR
jgi:eukaryotic-like serine/threonine-protein kinase